jgi:phospholipase/carboxylesterase
MLTTTEIETAPNPSAAIIWLHGLGADGHDFEPLVPELIKSRERAWRFVFPDAPIRPVTINGGMKMRAWYDILGFDRTIAEDLAGFRQTDHLVRELIEREAGRGIPPARVVLAGFSQGGAVTLYTGLRFPERLAGLLALSCYLPLAAALPAERAGVNEGVPIFQAHGIDDPVVPIAMGVSAREALKGLGYPLEWHQYRMPHSVSQPEIADIRQYLLRILP